MRAGAVAVSVVAFGWVVATAQGGCGTESSQPEGSEPAKALAPQVDVEQAVEPVPDLPTAELPPRVPADETPNAEATDRAAAEPPAAFFPASKSGGVGFGSAGAGNYRGPNPYGSGNNAGVKPKSKAFFPASKSGRVREPAPQAPNAPAKK